MNLRSIFVRRSNGRSWVMLQDRPGSWVSHCSSDVKRDYRRLRNLRALADHYCTSTVLIHRALNLIGVECALDLHHEHVQGSSCGKIAKQNGISEASLRKLFKNCNLTVYAGRSRRRLSQAEISQAAAKAKTVADAARHLHIAWSTARRVLLRTGQIIQTASGYLLIEGDEPPSGWCSRPRI